MGYVRFETAIGRCGLAWRDDRLTGVWLPDAPARDESPPPTWVQDLIARIVRLFEGNDVDLRDVPLDLDEVPEFDRRVYALVQSLPRGVTMTYGEVAHRLGVPHGAQAVGQAMAHNRFPIVVPCHRVVAAGGRNGGFSAPGGVDTKLRMLAIEGATLF